MAKRIKVVGPRRHVPATNWAVLVITAVLAGLVAGVVIVTLPNVPWDTRGTGLAGTSLGRP